jgi:hypothetical protein
MPSFSRDVVVPVSTSSTSPTGLLAMKYCAMLSFCAGVACGYSSLMAAQGKGEEGGLTGQGRDKEQMRGQ